VGGAKKGMSREKNSSASAAAGRQKSHFLPWIDRQKRMLMAKRLISLPIVTRGAKGRWKLRKFRNECTERSVSVSDERIENCFLHPFHQDCPLLERGCSRRGTKMFISMGFHSLRVWSSFPWSRKHCRSRKSDSNFWWLN
jgi:hypothetical protein